MDTVALDTTFLIDLQKYLEGFEDPTSAQALTLVAGLKILEVTPVVATAYARAARTLRAAGRLIGTNDLWIACTALAANVPLATRDTAHFSRVPGLTVVDYTTRASSR